MTAWIAHLVPSLGALGVWAYWIVGLAALLEAWFVTGVLAPGTLVVDAGGALARLGTLNPVELAWFVAVGAALGGEMGYWTGRRLGKRLTGRWDPARLGAYRRAEALFRRHGGLALVLGRFLGPVSGLAALAAALAGMEPRRFRIWNALSALPYAAVHVGLGYALGDVLARVGPQMERAAILAAVVLAALALIWAVSTQLRRGLPLALAALGAARDALLAKPWARRLAAAHPGLTGFLARRVATDRFEGLALTALAAVAVYVVAAWADSALDFLFEAQVAQTDLRLSRLIHAFWNPQALHAFGLVTQLGHWTVVTAMLAGATAALAIAGRRASLAQLWVALAGELITVRLLKNAFDRPRPELGFFVETSGSFPSGHATLSVAFWGTLCVIAWRERALGPTTALVLGATLAFLIGGSRIYLIEHYLSDVVNGWLVGTLWLVIGLAVAERMRAAGPAPRPSRPRLRAAALAAAAGVVAAGVLAALADPPRAAAQAEAPPEIVDPVAAAGTADLPLAVESLGGEARDPVAAVIAAPDLGHVVARLRAAGWREAEQPSPASLLRGAWHDLTEATWADAPLFPRFWLGHPQDAGLRSADGAAELRLWDSGERTPEGARLILAAPSPPGRDALARDMATPAAGSGGAAGAAEGAGATAPCPVGIAVADGAACYIPAP
ncbi:phosphatase PAP2 family protein [Albimonas sp. CAU 1670]|uniref:bifunctional DedA family/phosphatase PAP2 family protein n=1 Tax=Albimonas sp. CAU 1670 TaxID=3032599 RepID=UPI0023DA87D0|nr:bifunctional DedA family/phosphatase PAP2 family protein [Albimonas sp. CAU 1670]MDF2231832.1 phosphatase PAP2 family protein [Albimonas sp. CAU 1670]